MSKERLCMAGQDSLGNSPQCICTIHQLFWGGCNCGSLQQEKDNSLQCIYENKSRNIFIYKQPTGPRYIVSYIEISQYWFAMTYNQSASIDHVMKHGDFPMDRKGEVYLYGDFTHSEKHNKYSSKKDAVDAVYKYLTKHYSKS